MNAAATLLVGTTQRHRCAPKVRQQADPLPLPPTPIKPHALASRADTGPARAGLSIGAGVGASPAVSRVSVGVHAGARAVGLACAGGLRVGAQPHVHDSVCCLGPVETKTVFFLVLTEAPACDACLAWGTHTVQCLPTTTQNMPAMKPPMGDYHRPLTCNGTLDPSNSTHLPRPPPAPPISHPTTPQKLTLGAGAGAA